MPLVHTLLLVQQGDEINACLITNEEARDIGKLLGDPDFKLLPLWISTTQHTCLSGNKPKALLSNPQYTSLIEQARYFNGEFSLLNQQKEPLQWLNQNGAQKIQFFKNYLSPFRHAQPSDFAMLEAKISKQSVGFRHLRLTRFKPLTIIWEHLLPDALTDDITTLKNLAKAFDDINHHPFDGPDLNPNFFIQKYTLPIEAINELSDHLAIYQERQWIWRRFKTKPNFEKMALSKFETCVALMQILTGEGDDSIPAAPTVINYFFNQLDKMELNEWSAFIESPHFNRLVNTLPNDKFIELFKPSANEINFADWELMLKNLDDGKCQALIKVPTITSVHNVLILKNYLNTNHTFISQLIDAIPKHQFDRTIYLSIDTLNFDASELTKMAIKTSNRELKQKILTKKHSVVALLNTILTNMDKGNDRHSSVKESSLKRAVLSALLNATVRYTGNSRCDIEKVDPHCLLKLIQSLCDYKQHQGNFLWNLEVFLNIKAG